MPKLYLLIAFSFCKVFSYAQSVNLTSSNLPLFVINTNGVEIPDEPKITAEMGIVYNGEGVRNNLTDAFNEYSGKIGIEVRGQSSQSFPMKSYSIELRDEDGESVDQPLFGMPQESDWVLYAPYTDKTLMRNFLAYTMSNSLGHWAAHCRFVELVLNGEYKGVYVFMEKIKRDEGRVNISKLKSGNTTGDALTGGYIFSIDKEPDGWFSSYAPNGSGNGIIQFSYVYPKLEDIVPQQQDYIKSYVDSFENALKGNNYQDPVAGFRKFADENSFIDYFIVNEISRNVDGYRLSTYLYKDRNSINNKIICGPVWDYDLAFRNADYCDGSFSTGWAYQFNKVCEGDYFQVPFWWDRFMEDTAFKSRLLCRWKDVRQNVLSNARIDQLIDSVYNLVAEAQQRHFEQWPILGQYVWPNASPIPTTYAEEISTLKTWVAGRLSWIDNNLPSTGACAGWPVAEKRTFVLKMPNPVSDFYSAVIESKNSQRLQIRVIDMQGRVLNSVSINAVAGINKLPNSTQLNNMQRGIYFIQVFNDAGEKISNKIFKN